MPKTRSQKRVRETKSGMKAPKIPIPKVPADSPNCSSITTSWDEDELICPICLELFIQPVVLGCGHDFCQYCIEKWNSNKLRPECPVCRAHIQKIASSISLSKVMEKLYRSSPDMKTRCEALLKEREGHLSGVVSSITVGLPGTTVHRFASNQPALAQENLEALVGSGVSAHSTALTVTNIHAQMGHGFSAEIGAPGPHSARIGNLVPGTVPASPRLANSAPTANRAAVTGNSFTAKMENFVHTHPILSVILVPIVSGLAGILLGGVLGLIYEFTTMNHY